MPPLDDLAYTAEKPDPVAEAIATARQAGLRYVSDEKPGISRRKAGAGFAYYDAKGKLIRDPDLLKRVRSLAVPPAYTDVWICPHENGHIQATGRDAKGRKQYRYHPRWTETRDATKYEHMIEFADALPALRAKVREHMGLRGLKREKVLATVVHLLETTLIRVGNEDYVKENESFGLTTLRNQHVEVEGGELRFDFKGKSGKMWKLQMRDRRIARIIRACQDLPGQHLFQYVDDEGASRDVTSQDVNDYLREISGRDITAKDFRTWAGTVLAAMALREFASFDSQAHAKKNIKAAIERVSARLGNTPTICRKCYVHPEVLGAYLEGEVLQAAEAVEKRVEAELRDNLEQLKPEEAALLAMLQKRLGQEVAEKKSRAA